MKVKIIKKSADKNVDNSIVFRVAIHKGEGEVIRKKAMQELRDALISVLKHNDDYAKSNIILADSVNNPEVYKDFIEAGEKDGCYFEYMEIIFTKNSTTTSDGLHKVLKAVANKLVEKHHVGICMMTSDTAYYCRYKLYEALRRDFDKEYMEIKETIDGSDSCSIHENDVDIRIQVSCPNPEVRRKATELIRSEIHNGLKGNFEYINSDIVLTDSLQYPSQYPAKDDKTEIVEVVMSPSITTSRAKIIHFISHAICECRLNNPVVITVETDNLSPAYKRVLLNCVSSNPNPDINIRLLIRRKKHEINGKLLVKATKMITQCIHDKLAGIPEYDNGDILLSDDLSYHHTEHPSEAAAALVDITMNHEISQSLKARIASLINDAIDTVILNFPIKVNVIASGLNKDDAAIISRYYEKE